MFDDSPAVPCNCKHDFARRRILILEDEFLLAADIAEVLRSANADIIGPFSTEVAALRAIENATPSAAVLDINLDRGSIAQSFSCARALLTRGAPFVFVSGYERRLLPAAFEHIRFFQKPVELALVVAALVDLPSP